VSEAAVAQTVESRRRTSIVATSLIVAAFLAVSIVFATQTTWYFVFKMLHVGAAVLWVGGGLFIAICAILAELANDDDQLLEIGRLAD
jgi:small neutral amino acid transporter SnatA (MarC family)